MPNFTGSDWIVVIGAVFAGIATAVGTLRARRSSSPQAPVLPVVQLDDRDRAVLSEVADIVSRGVTRIEAALDEHRRAVVENSDHLRRSRGD